MIHAFKIIFILLLSYTLLSTGLSENIPSTFTVVNYLLLAIPCVFYFNETFTETPSNKLVPSACILDYYWQFIYGNLHSPILFARKYISKYLPTHKYLFYNLNYIFYCLIFHLFPKLFYANRCQIIVFFLLWFLVILKECNRRHPVFTPK